MITPKENSDHFSYDISERIISKGEVFDEDAISQSISQILGTNRGERVMNINFGSSLGFRLFEIMDQRSGEELLNTIVRELYVYLENQIVIDESSMTMNIDKDNNSMQISIPYRIKNSAKRSIYKKKFIF
jgi:phage baseplate assembly protein W